MRPLRIGILGAGGIAARHAAAIAANPEAATLVACCGRDPDKAAAFAAAHGGRAYSERERMLDEADLDILIVALPPFAHSDEVESAARRGIHLLLEKPIALDGDHADRMVAAAEAAGIRTQVGFMGRFGAAVERWTELAAAGATGRPGLYSARFHCNALHAPWWREKAKSGGQMVEQLIHMIDLARYVLGDPATVYARTATFFHRGVERYDSDDLSAMLLGYDDGRVALLSATNGAVPGRWEKEIHLVAERMTGHFTDWNTATLTRTAGEPAAERIAETRDVFATQLLDLVDAVRSGCPARTPIRDGARSLHLALAALRSAEERREVAF
ncbi:Gfo/Idh/MocA family oxidoreductase [Inquilinus limosus]|uniref:Gfo/Idh/MocA family protein n=1 Tax=Inquilinus limosus TaxID=171674 RepID=UPI003F15353D